MKYLSLKKPVDIQGSELLREYLLAASTQRVSRLSLINGNLTFNRRHSKYQKTAPNKQNKGTSLKCYFQ